MAVYRRLAAYKRKYRELGALLAGFTALIKCSRILDHGSVLRFGFITEPIGFIFLTICIHFISHASFTKNLFSLAS